jgi:hypothetical protein
MNMEENILEIFNTPRKEREFDGLNEERSNNIDRKDDRIFIFIYFYCKINLF